MVKMCLFQLEFHLKEKFRTLIGGNLIGCKHSWFLCFGKEMAPWSLTLPPTLARMRSYSLSSVLKYLCVAEKVAFYQKQDLSCAYLRSFVTK